MKKEIGKLKKYLNQDVKIFPKDSKDPITGKVTLLEKNYIVVLAKKAIKQENKIIYKNRTIKRKDIERISLM